METNPSGSEKSVFFEKARPSFSLSRVGVPTVHENSVTGFLWQLSQSIAFPGHFLKRVFVY